MDRDEYFKKHRERTTHTKNGVVVRILYGQSHGFVRTAETANIFFHRSAVPHHRFNALACGDQVEFELIDDVIAGPRAIRVRRL